jgi:hypothetical protein
MSMKALSKSLINIRPPKPLRTLIMSGVKVVSQLPPQMPVLKIRVYLLPTPAGNFDIKPSVRSALFWIVPVPNRAVIPCFTKFRIIDNGSVVTIDTAVFIYVPPTAVNALAQYRQVRSQEQQA